ncbi:hypothetical protein CMQ_5543 [Grosmannia clavigera kw1407]|uniref:Uncharacterized protein n=1 Tax=Grosmannia clavigera (strain kw1407 / UAMH 11150) TaxID=655863 RepID=F0XSX4_GROCL|nr:uncharacterized protein CMQ_5543 [Grosmannia clavigera kw1407]EFW99122.1 hypothetical protein CMQ_5543 [Grosmannia clavigera kw1407]
MATATLISPNTPYYPHHPTSFPSGGYHGGHSQNHGPSSMISPVESRRTPDDHEPPHRQSLPSIQEVIGKGPSGSYSSSAQPPPPTSIPQQSLPSPFSTNVPARPFPSEPILDRQPSPRILHRTGSSSSLYGARPDTFPNSMRSHFPGRSLVGAHPSPPPNIDTQPGLSPVSQQHHQLQQGQQLPQPMHPHNHQYQYPPQRERDPKPKHDDGPSHLGAYSHASSQNPYASQQQQQQQPPPQQQQQLPLPSAQTPVSGSYPVSPRHAGPRSLPSPFEPQQPHCLADGSPEFSRNRTSRYDQTVNRHFEAWSYAEYLSKIGTNSRTIYNFAEAFGSIAREEHSPQPMPGRMPSDREVCDMINNAEWLKTMLEHLRSIVQQTVVNDRGSNNSVRQKTQSFDDSDTPIYGDPSGKPYNTLNEVKKRRGPPVQPELTLFNSVPPHQDDATVATALTLQNGDGDPTALAHPVQRLWSSLR